MAGEFACVEYGKLAGKLAGKKEDERAQRKRETDESSDVIRSGAKGEGKTAG